MVPTTHIDIATITTINTSFETKNSVNAAINLTSISVYHNILLLKTILNINLFLLTTVYIFNLQQNVNKSFQEYNTINNKQIVYFFTFFILYNMKEKFIISTLTLIMGGFLTKILGMIIKIVMTRYIGFEGTGLYMMILPTFSLFIGLAQAGFPIALSKLIAEDNRNNKKLFFSLIPLALVINIFLMLIIIIIAPYLATNLLHDKRCLLGIYAIALVIPFTTLSSLCRSYFFGKQKMLPHVTSNIIEDIVRLLIIIIYLPPRLANIHNATLTFYNCQNRIVHHTHHL